MREVSSHRFRSGYDINIWSLQYWQYASNDFYPRNPNIGTHFSLVDDLERVDYMFCKNIKNHTKLLCLNDETTTEENLEKVEKYVINFFERILPQKSGFEI